MCLRYFANQRAGTQVCRRAHLTQRGRGCQAQDQCCNSDCKQRPPPSHLEVHPHIKQEDVDASPGSFATSGTACRSKTCLQVLDAHKNDAEQSPKLQGIRKRLISSLELSTVSQSRLARGVELGGPRRVCAAQARRARCDPRLLPLPGRPNALVLSAAEARHAAAGSHVLRGRCGTLQRLQRWRSRARPLARAPSCTHTMCASPSRRCPATSTWTWPPTTAAACARRTARTCTRCSPRRCRSARGWPTSAPAWRCTLSTSTRWRRCLRRSWRARSCW